MEAKMKVKSLLMMVSLILFLMAVIPLSAQTVDITGVWKAEFDTQIGIQKYIFEFKKTDTGITGSANSDIGGEKQVAPLTEIKLDSNRISFVEMLSFQGNDLRINYEGTVSGNEMKLTRNVGEFASEELVAKREETTGSEM